VTHDVVVVGAGMAGMSAAVRMAEGGLSVLVVAKGHGSTHLAPATIDVLGYTPERVDSPAAALPAFIETRPDHPYAKLSVADVSESVDWFKGQIDGPRYVGDVNSNLLLPSAAGAARPSAVVSETMAGGDLRSGGTMLICGFDALKDFYPALAADNLRAGAAADGRPRIDARGVVLSPPVGGEADVGGLAFARHFEDAEFRKAVIAGAAKELEGEDAVGFPAVLGLSDARTVWGELQDGLGRPVFEIPTLPPSVPGIRVFTALHDRLRRAGGRLVMGVRAQHANVARGRVQAVVVGAAARDVAYSARWFVVATGGFASGGIEIDSYGEARETVFGLPLSGIPDPGEPRFSPIYLDDHPLGAAGVRTDEALRPVDADGQVVHDNLFAVGAVLGGAEPWREKSGEGISLSTASKAAKSILHRASRARRRTTKGDGG